MMKKIIYILLLAVIAVSCKRNDFIEGPAVSFYPSVVATGAEQDGNSYTVRLATSQFVTGTSTVTIQLDMSASGAIETVPPLDGDKLTLDITNNNLAEFSVTIQDDATADDYIAIFRILEATGGFEPSTTNEFKLFVTDTDTAPLFSDDFENGLGEWTIINIDGNQTWGTSEFNNNTTALVSAFGSGSVEDEDNWLISPELNFDVYEGEFLSFLTQGRFNDEGNELEVSILSGFDGSDPFSGTRTILEPTLDPHSGGGFGTLTNSGKLDLSGISGVGHVAFRHSTVNERDEAGWELDDVLVAFYEPSVSNGGTSEIVDLPFDTDFEDCSSDFGVPSGFQELFAADAKTDRGWGCRSFGVGDSRGVRVNSFGGDTGIEDAWLITEARYDFGGFIGGKLTFDVRSEFSGDGRLRVYYTDFYLGGDPSGFDWVEIESITNQLPAKGSNVYSTVTADIYDLRGRDAFIAFRFDDASELGSATYDIDNILLEGLSPPPIPLPFNDDFESCGTVGDFNIPTNWIEEIVPGNNTDRGWGCRAFGRSGNGVQASAFGGDGATDNSWLISNGVLDLTELSSTSMEFYVESFFDGAGGIKLLWSDDYSGIGNPLSATWTEVTDATDQFPDAGSGGFEFISTNLDDALGKKIYIAFQYESSSTDASSWTLDDMSITGN